MSINKKQFEELIKSTLEEFASKMNTEAAVNLLLGTAAKESNFGTYLRQVRGPALGFFQMEPATEAGIWRNYIVNMGKMGERILLITGVSGPDLPALRANIAYQIIMARLHYRRIPAPLPAADDVCGLGKYWKKYYNTYKGRGTAKQFVKKYKKYVG